MKMSSKRYVGMFLSIAALSPACAAPALAHDTWAVMEDYTVKKARTATLAPVSSHVFAIPARDFMAGDRVQKIVFVGPGGVEIPSAPNGNGKYKSNAPLKAKGTYLAALLPAAGFFSKTTEGYKQGKTRKDLNDVVECKYSEKCAKALFTVDTPGGDAFSKVIGAPMEIVPLQDPAGLKQGDVLPVKILLNGKPVSTTVFGTYAGFSEDPGTFAYTTSSNKQGIAKIKLIKDGTWLLLAKQEFPYPDKTVCDKNSYASSLTFRIGRASGTR